MIKFLLLLVYLWIYNETTSKKLSVQLRYFKLFFPISNLISFLQALFYISFTNGRRIRNSVSLVETDI